MVAKKVKTNKAYNNESFEDVNFVPYSKISCKAHLYLLKFKFLSIKLERKHFNS